MSDERNTEQNGKNSSLRLSRRELVALVGAMLTGASGSASEAFSALTRTEANMPQETQRNDSTAMAQNLRCEYRIDPLGIDAIHPRLSWTMAGSRRGERQTAYQVLVASDPQTLAQDHGDLWDSDRVHTGQSSQVVYAGKPLTSRARCHWKVRLWDQNGHPTSWSKSAFWTVGLLHPADWQANWITDAALADPANRPRTPIHCYRSGISDTPDTTIAITLDLGVAKTFDGTCLQPAKPPGLSGDIETILYPVRFKIEAANASDFHDAAMIVDKTKQDVKPPRPGFYDAERYTFPKTTARYVRLTVSRLAFWDGIDYALALGRFQVFDGETDIAAGASVETSNSVESDQWSRRFLTDPQTVIAYNETPDVLKPKMGGIDSASRVPMLRREFTLDKPIQRATLYCSARGFYEARLNGQRISEDLLAPGYTEYDRRLEYQAYDVTHLIHKGANVLGALLGYGWYAGHMNLSDNEYLYGYFPQFLAQLEIDYADGKREIIGSDGDWKSTLDGPVRWSDLLDGEGYDCRREMPGWDESHFDASDWKSVAVIPRDTTPIVWQRAQPVRRMEELKPIGVKEVSSGVWVFDLGQEFAGWCRLKADGPAGTRVTLRHAEERHADGTINQDSLWGTLAEEDYILAGLGPKVLEPHFTYHGFRFVEVTGLAQPPTDDTLVGVHIRTDASQVGHFECSNALYNKLMTASRWTQQNMMFDVPTGCAGRSERLSWTGDIRPCVQTALFQFDTSAFFEKYAADLRADQTEEGRFTDIAPHAHLRDTPICVGSPGWADAGVSLPWQLYLNTGDQRILADHFDAARRWVDYIHSQNPDLIWTNALGMAWGDWLSAGTPTPMPIGATAFFAHSTDLVSRMADVLGRKADADRYQSLFHKIKAAFADHFVTPEGLIFVKPKQPADVTETVRGLVKDDSLSFTVGNDALGIDPAPNVVKSLHLIYQIGAQRKTRDYPEGSQIDLNGAGQPLNVISALYSQSITDTKTRDVQGSYALALHFDLLDEPMRSRAIARLAEVIARDGGHPTTGFWSSIELLLALSQNGHHDLAAQMLNLTTRPSWGYMVQGDGTTFWEAFDADTRTLSLNHWTHSAIGEWLWRHVAGIAPDPDHPGYEAIIIRPRPCAEVDSCLASYDSLRGPISVQWNKSKDLFTLDLTIPANMTATVYLPASDKARITESGQPIARSHGLQFLRHEAGNSICRVESGTYYFVVPTHQ